MLYLVKSLAGDIRQELCDVRAVTYSCVYFLFASYSACIDSRAYPQFYISRDTWYFTELWYTAHLFLFAAKYKWPAEQVNSNMMLDVNNVSCVVVCHHGGL